MSAWLVYWVLKLDVIVGLSTFFGIVGLLLVVVGFVVHFINSNRRPYWDHHKNKDGTPSDKFNTEIKMWFGIARAFKKCLIPGIVLAFLSVTLPNTQQAVIIYVLPKIANNEQVQQIPKKLLDIGNKQLDEWVKKYTPRASEGKK